MNAPQKKVYVGMSGGVDSSVAVALLKKAGYDVTGVFIKVWHPDWLPCAWKEERRDAMRVAAKLDIPFITLDLAEDYKREVVDYMLREYARGRTPNPDVMCNKEIKFGSFLRRARELGADYVATGHYAGVAEEGGEYRLTESKDAAKDQTYFLWTLGQEELSCVLFPLRSYEKQEVRALAKKFALPTAEKKDSQGICFIGKVDMKEFLSHYITSRKGDVVNEAGEKIGEHDGVIFYTIGQRHGFAVSEKFQDALPYYIVAKDTNANTLTVSHKLQSNNELNLVKSVKLIDVHWIRQIPDQRKYSARFRYRQPLQSVRVQTYDTSSTALVTCDIPQGGISRGQSVVIYDGDECIGGGIIDEVVI